MPKVISDLWYGNPNTYLLALNTKLFRAIGSRGCWRLAEPICDTFQRTLLDFQLARGKAILTLFLTKRQKKC